MTGKRGVRRPRPQRGAKAAWQSLDDGGHVHALDVHGGMEAAFREHIEQDLQRLRVFEQLVLGVDPRVSGKGVGLHDGDHLLFDQPHHFLKQVVVLLLVAFESHDEILPGTARLVVGVDRPTNNAGGLEGGVTNGQDLRVSGYMKPIATLMKPLRSVDLTTMEESPAAIERSDVCAVPAAAVVGEAMVALVLADAAMEKFGGDSIQEIVDNFRAFRDRTAARFVKR